jgi:hypothetical protein
MTLESTETSTRVIYLLGISDQCLGLTTLPPSWTNPLEFRTAPISRIPKDLSKPVMEYLFIFLWHRSRDSSVGVVTRLRDWWPRNFGFIPGQGAGFLCLQLIAVVVSTQLRSFLPRQSVESMKLTIHCECGAKFKNAFIAAQGQVYPQLIFVVRFY